MSAIGHILYDWFGLNRELFLLVNGVHGALYDQLMLALTAAAARPHFAWYMAALLLLARAAPRLVPLANVVTFGIAFPIVDLVANAIKAATTMPRPVYALGEHAVVLLDHQSDGASFPSGHTAFAALLAASLTPGAPALLRWLLWLFVALVALSRVALGAHFPADTLGGLIVGAGVALVIRALLLYWGSGGRRAV